jgi:hypothetical protein
MCTPDQTARQKDGSIKLVSLNLSYEMIGILDVMRALFSGWSDHANRQVPPASDVAEVWFGRGTGLGVAEQVISLVSAMRSARRSVFRFSNPMCPVCREFVTPHELALLNVITHASAGRKADSRADAIVVCEGFDERVVVEAAQSLAAALKTLSASTASVTAGERRVYGRN